MDHNQRLDISDYGNDSDPEDKEVQKPKQIIRQETIQSLQNSESDFNENKKQFAEKNFSSAKKINDGKNKRVQKAQRTQEYLKNAEPVVNYKLSIVTENGDENMKDSIQSRKQYPQFQNSVIKIEENLSQIQEVKQSVGNSEGKQLNIKVTQSKRQEAIERERPKNKKRERQGFHFDPGQQMDDLKTSHKVQQSLEEKNKNHKKEVENMKEKMIVESKKEHDKLEKWTKEENQKKEKDEKIQNEIKQQLRNLKLNESMKTTRQSDERRELILSVKDKIMGNITIVWIFLFDEQQLTPEIQSKIKEIYKGQAEGYFVPICRSIQEMLIVLDINDARFKIISDLSLIKDALKFHNLSKVVEYYIFNQSKEEGIKEAIELKMSHRKIKGIYHNIEKLLEKAEDEIQYEVLSLKKSHFSDDEEVTINNEKMKKKLPSFLSLCGEDKADANLYRANLYGAINMLNADRAYRLMDFMSFVLQKQRNRPRQVKNIQRYGQFSHLGAKKTQNHEQILKFYTEETFYYRNLNLMLRGVKAPEEFRICSLPFSENYHAIKHFYKEYLRLNKGKLPEKVLWRGVKNMKEKDLQKLRKSHKYNIQEKVVEEGEELFIEMYGFLSTSASKKMARKFTEENDGIMFAIHIPEMTISEEYKQFDHGFVDMNKFNLSKIPVQEEFLFNPLNIFKVKGWVEQEKDGKTWTEYHLEYGVIFDLMIKSKCNELTELENDIFINYQYCQEMQKKIEDEGDVFLLANNPETAKQYYENKKRQLKEEQQEIMNNMEGDENLSENKQMQDNREKRWKISYKLAVIHKNLGELLEAQKEAKESLQLIGDKINKADKEKCMKVFAVHKQNSKCSEDNEDYEKADEEAQKAMDNLPDEQTEEELFIKAKTMRERGDIRFKKGEIEKAQDDFSLSEQIFQGILDSAQEQRSKNKREKMFRKISYFFSCRCQNFGEIEQWQNEEEQKIKKREKLVSGLKKQVDNELLTVNNSIKEVAIYVEDKSKYQSCVVKARGYLAELKASKTKDPYEKAKLKVVEATVKTYLALHQSEKLMNEAIELIEKQDPNNEQIAKYCEVLANFQKNHLQKLTSSKANLLSTEVKDEEEQEQKKESKEPEKYDDVETKEVYSKCQKNFERAINILLYNNKSKQSPEVKKLQENLATLHYNMDNFKSCEEVIAEIRQKKDENPRSEHAKATLILSRIFYCRGELKLAFKFNEEADETLKKALVKKETQGYFKTYRHSDIYIEAHIHRSKIYTRQLKYDMSLKTINQVSQIVREKFPNSRANPYLPELYIQKGEIKTQSIMKKLKKQNFSKQLKQDSSSYYNEAIIMVEKQRGIANPINITFYCSYILSLVNLGDFEMAKKTLLKLAQIVSTLPLNHPSMWIVFYCYGLYEQRRKKLKESLTLYKNCLKVIRNKFDLTHISVARVRLQYAAVLFELGQREQFRKQFYILNHELQKNLNSSKLRASSYNSQFNEDRDTDEKNLMNQTLKELKVKYQKKYDELLNQDIINMFEQNLMEENESMKRSEHDSQIGLNSRKENSERRSQSSKSRRSARMELIKIEREELVQSQEKHEDMEEKKEKSQFSERNLFEVGLRSERDEILSSRRDLENSEVMLNE